MYLKRLEMVGFKSFALRTVLDFEPGMTAVVGPNGCGKSNVADAIRWVLGEQRVKAMRGSKMEDCIFTGTDAVKALNMAEVSLTLADCEEVLGTEYHEVTVTRRFFRSGEGQYLINKTACRLKDIQRLFMDTGVGTDSYSLMEQGRIDRILSARPEDRRAVFEEASGITKYKADKKEALRKLEQTEANLVRLDDIIREVKRQIISLQRQAGKARRYKVLKDELSGLDVFLARSELELLDQRMETLAGTHTAQLREGSKLSAQLHALEEEATEARNRLQTIEAELDTEMQSGARVLAELDKARERLTVNGERILEFRDMAARDGQEAETARQQWEEQKTTLAELAAQHEETVRKRVASENELNLAASRLKEVEGRVETSGRQVHKLRSEGIDVDNSLAKLQNELSDLEARERSSLLRRERLNTERDEWQRHVLTYEAQLEGMTAQLATLEQAVKAQESACNRLLEEQQQRRRQRGEGRDALERQRNSMAGLRAQRDLLEKGEKAAEGFSGGARHLLEEPRAAALTEARILGPLAHHLVPEPAYRVALEAVLRSWLDAVIVHGEADALLALTSLRQSDAGSVRLLTSDQGASPATEHHDGPGEPLLDHVTVSTETTALGHLLLGGVRVVDVLEDAGELGPQGIWVTAGGEIRRGAFCFELWVADEAEGNPLARKAMIHSLEKEIDTLAVEINAAEARLQALSVEEETGEKAVQEARRALDEVRRNWAVQQGEQKVLERERRQAREKAGTVVFELGNLEKSGSSTADRRAAIRSEMEGARERQTVIRTELATLTEHLREAESARSKALNEVTELRVQFSGQRREEEHLRQRHQSCEARIRELNALMTSRTERVLVHRQRVEGLEARIAEIRASVPPLEEQVRNHETRLADARERRKVCNQLTGDLAQRIHLLHSTLARIQEERARTEIELAEQRMRRQNLLERVAADYRVDEEGIRACESPASESEVPQDPETMRRRVSELKRKLQEMGPVNLVAIEEYQQLEERHDFLVAQHADLTQSREQLLEMIRSINRTSTELFMNTFNSVNAYFQAMFKRMFGGGSAHLELMECEDVLEAGVEIIARPPGKKLQSISLMSGGERTMTAVALLFALYQEKPSPFCVLDELDAALDESNITRFVDVVQDFTRRSQFILITHNQKTIAAADVLYGVTMAQQGISRIVSVKFHGKQLNLLEP